jgi:hypothetical protein
MKSRYEYKFLVPSEIIDIIREEILLFMEEDDFAKRHKSGQYTVRSIYYDTPKFTCYKEKLDGVQHRNKYRIRGYDKENKDSLAFLEIKQKNTNCISKSRAPLHYTNVFKSLRNNDLKNYVISFSGNGAELKDGEKFIYNYHKKNLRPAVLVIYDREAFWGKFDKSLRITFDKNLRSAIFPNLKALYSEEGVKKIMNKNFILEVKFYGMLPMWIKSLLSKYELKREALSKYTMSLEAHDEFNYKRFIHSGIISNREVFCA